jgi:uncharacterized protein (DUF983 family)
MYIAMIQSTKLIGTSFSFPDPIGTALALGIVIILGVLSIGTARNPTKTVQFFLIGVAFLLVVSIFLYIIFTTNNSFSLLGNLDNLNTNHSTVLQSVGDSDPVNRGVPCVLCPKCLEEDIKIWVISGKACPRCGTECES